MEYMPVAVSNTLQNITKSGRVISEETVVYISDDENQAVVAVPKNPLVDPTPLPTTTAILQVQDYKHVQKIQFLTNIRNTDYEKGTVRQFNHFSLLWTSEPVGMQKSSPKLSLNEDILKLTNVAKYNSERNNSFSAASSGSIVSPTLPINRSVHLNRPPHLNHIAPTTMNTTTAVPFPPSQPFLSNTISGSFRPSSKGVVGAPVIAPRVNIAPKPIPIAIQTNIPKMPQHVQQQVHRVPQQQRHPPTPSILDELYAIGGPVHGRNMNQTLPSPPVNLRFQKRSQSPPLETNTKKHKVESNQLPFPRNMPLPTPSTHVPPPVHGSVNVPVDIFTSVSTTTDPLSTVSVYSPIRESNVELETWPSSSPPKHSENNRPSAPVSVTETTPPAGPLFEQARNSSMDFARKMSLLIQSSKKQRGNLSSPNESIPKAMYAAKLPQPVILDVQAAQASQAIAAAHEISKWLSNQSPAAVSNTAATSKNNVGLPAINDTNINNTMSRTTAVSSNANVSLGTRLLNSTQNEMNLNSRTTLLSPHSKPEIDRTTENTMIQIPGSVAQATNPVPQMIHLATKLPEFPIFSANVDLDRLFCSDILDAFSLMIFSDIYSVDLLNLTKNLESLEQLMEMILNVGLYYEAVMDIYRHFLMFLSNKSKIRDIRLQLELESFFQSIEEDELAHLFANNELYEISPTDHIRALNLLLAETICDCRDLADERDANDTQNVYNNVIQRRQTDYFLGVDREGKRYWFIPAFGDILQSMQRKLPMGIMIERDWSLRKEKQTFSFITSLQQFQDLMKALDVSLSDEAHLKKKLDLLFNFFKKKDTSDLDQKFESFEKWIKKIVTESRNFPPESENIYNMHFFGLANQIFLELGEYCGFDVDMVVFFTTESNKPFSELRSSIIKFHSEGRIAYISDLRIDQLKKITTYFNFVSWCKSLQGTLKSRYINDRNRKLDQELKLKLLEESLQSSGPTTRRIVQDLQSETASIESSKHSTRKRVSSVVASESSSSSDEGGPILSRRKKRQQFNLTKPQNGNVSNEEIQPKGSSKSTFRIIDSDTSDHSNDDEIANYDARYESTLQEYDSVSVSSDSDDQIEMEMDDVAPTITNQTMKKKSSVKKKSSKILLPSETIVSRSSKDSLNTAMDEPLNKTLPSSLLSPVKKPSVKGKEPLHSSTTYTNRPKYPQKVGLPSDNISNFRFHDATEDDINEPKPPTSSKVTNSSKKPEIKKSETLVFTAKETVKGQESSKKTNAESIKQIPKKEISVEISKVGTSTSSTTDSTRDSSVSTEVKKMANSIVIESGSSDNESVTSIQSHISQISQMQTKPSKKKRRSSSSNIAMATNAGSKYKLGSTTMPTVRLDGVESAFTEKSIYSLGIFDEFQMELSCDPPAPVQMEPISNPNTNSISKIQISIDSDSD